MKNRIVTAGIVLLIFGGFLSCVDDPIEAGFEDMVRLTIYDYIVENEEEYGYSHFLRILERGGIHKTMSAYNPRGIGYTMFLPDNDAVNRFIDSSPMFNSLDELLADEVFAAAFSRYHVVNLALHSDDFPFGAFPEPTLSDDLLTVNFVLGDSSYYLINNQAPVKKANIEVSNGYIHIIGEALSPVSLTTYRWLQLSGGFSIFLEAMELTGFDEIADINVKDESNDARPFTLLVEHDSIYRKHGVNSIDDLVERISPGNQNYTDPANPLYNFVGYHMLTEHHFLDDFAGRATNYTTLGEVPLHIYGHGNDLLINRGKEIFDVIVTSMDTIFIDWIGFNYDASNVLTQSGVIHFIDRMMRPQQPTRATQWFNFWEEPYFNQFRQLTGTHPIENPSLLSVIDYSGADLYFIRLAQGEVPDWDRNFLEISGDFSITYNLPRIVQGRYRVWLRADRWSAESAVVEVYIDGVKLGGLVNLHNPNQNPNSPFGNIEIGTIDFSGYSGHTVEVRSLIPGRFRWRELRFDPI
jgi:hypothetical protein